MWLTFVYLPTFDRNAEGILSDEDLTALEDRLLADPQHGALIPGTGGVRKVRVSLGSRGRSGGARVLYYYLTSDASVYFLDVFQKNVKETLTASEKSTLRSLAKALKRDRVMAGEKTFGERLIAGMEEAVAVREGRVVARIRRRQAADQTMPVPPFGTAVEIQSLRASLGVSQHAFAGFLNVSVSTVRAWEHGSRRPSGPAIRLLEIISRNPKAFITAP